MRRRVQPRALQRLEVGPGSFEDPRLMQWIEDDVHQLEPAGGFAYDLERDGQRLFSGFAEIGGDDDVLEGRHGHSSRMPDRCWRMRWQRLVAMHSPFPQLRATGHSTCLLGVTPRSTQVRLKPDTTEPCFDLA